MNRYIWMVFVGACSFGILSTFVKLAYREGYTAAEIAVTQAFSGMMFLWLLVRLYGNRKEGAQQVRLSWQDRWPLLLTGTTIGLTTFVYYVSVQYIPASIAIVILMQFTWIGVLIDWIFYKQRPGLPELMTILFILGGTLLSGGLLKQESGSLSVTGLAFAGLSALFYAIYVVANSRVGTSIQPLRKSAVIMAGSTLGIFLFNAPDLIASTHFGPGLLKWALFLSLFGTVIPPVLFAAGIPKIGASLSAIIMTAELPVAVICSHLILKEEVSGLQWLGVIIMLVSTAMLNLLKSRRTREALH
ncbi:EamA family transporter [Chitinophaga flava]|uniref:EamA family transporter n=1 Tax=Chitinophaga flava TaxID=2259036 RepID=A0A365XW90_9BACT|nr:DMT family transporter [Chitinophaga flava]RBL90632.1 EamA family transporter [Chitinophaga flava]